MKVWEFALDSETLIGLTLALDLYASGLNAIDFAILSEEQRKQIPITKVTKLWTGVVQIQEQFLRLPGNRPWYFVASNPGAHEVNVNGEIGVQR